MIYQIFLLILVVELILSLVACLILELTLSWRIKRILIFIIIMARGKTTLLTHNMDQMRKLSKIECICFIVYFAIVTVFVSVSLSAYATILITVAYVFPYLITGLIGLYGSIKSQITFIKIYIGFVIFLVCLNVAAIALSIIFVIILGIDYNDETCSSTIDENCSFNEVVIIVFMIMLCLNVIISICLLFLCYASYQHGILLRNMLSSMKPLEMDSD